MSCARAVSHRTCAPLRGLTSTDCQSGGLVLRYPLHRAPGRQVTSLTARRRSIRIAGSAELVSVDVQLEGHEEGVLTPTQRSPPSALLPHHLHSEPRLTCWCQPVRKGLLNPYSAAATFVRKLFVRCYLARLIKV